VVNAALPAGRFHGVSNGRTGERPNGIRLLVQPVVARSNGRSIDGFASEHGAIGPGNGEGTRGLSLEIRRSVRWGLSWIALRLLGRPHRLSPIGKDLQVGRIRWNNAVIQVLMTGWSATVAGPRRTPAEKVLAAS
jgi:hypothetical protein